MSSIPSRRDLLRAAVALTSANRLLAWQESSPDAKFSSDVKVVNVLANVHDKDNKVVSTLTKDDFSIDEDGRPQVIRYFARQSDLPLTLGLLVDTSGSESRNIESEKRASYKFFDQVMREGTDKAFLIHFDREVELLQDITSSKTQLDKGLDGLTGDQMTRRSQQGQGGGPGRGGGGTALYDSVLLASEELMQKQQGRKAIVLFSDGEDNGSKVTLSRAIESAQRADTLVYAVRFYDRNAGAPIAPVFGGRGRRGGGFPGGGGGGGNGYPGGYPNASRKDGKAVMQQISSETGGAYFEVSGGMTLDKIYARIQDELRNQYSLGYTSDQTGAGYRRIKVTAKGKNLTVQAREGYYAQ
ncbi:MAG TPA: VWA domain-containing protein [Bryobacteraceae bacterium]|jgi:VWFA-related protein